MSWDEYSRGRKVDGHGGGDVGRRMYVCDVYMISI
jgi:hypothetical protein